MGRTFHVDADGLLAICIQHEMDHLTGRVFVEYLSQLKQTRIRSRMRKTRSRYGVIRSRWMDDASGGRGSGADRNR